LKTQRPPKRFNTLNEGLKLALSEKPLSLEFTPLEVYIYGNAFIETNNIIKPNVKKKRHN
jgi:hypothetical protein